MHTIVETPTFIRNAEQAGVSDVERQRIVSSVARNPLAGDLIEGTGGLRKRRFAGRGKGKSGGYRAIIAYLGPNTQVFLLALYGKGAKSDLTADERAVFKKFMTEMKKTAR